MEEPFREGKPPYNGIVSTDTRAWKQVEKWYSDGTNKKVYEKTFQEIPVQRKGLSENR